jgi:hypothetical protein
MRSLFLTSVATAALLAGLVAASAQQSSGGRADPSAAEQTQQTPRARNTAKEPAASRAQQESERQGPARAAPDKSTATQSNQRQADQPQQRSRGDARNDKPTTAQSGERQADRPSAQRERADEDRSRTPARERTSTAPSKQRTTGQSSDDMRRETPRRGEAERRDTTQDRGSRAERQQDSTARGSIKLSSEQRTRIATRFSERIDRMNVRPLSRSQFSVSVGALLPRSVRAYPVPRDIVTVYPEFRNHQFVVVEDDIVIVEPRSQRVVTVLPMSGERRAAGSATRETTGTAPAESRISLSPREREVIRTVVMREPACRLEQRIEFFLFVPLPRTVEVCELPPQIVSEVPEVSRYRYTVRGDEIVLVDPDEYKVIEVIR